MVKMGSKSRAMGTLSCILLKDWEYRGLRGLREKAQMDGTHASAAKMSASSRFVNYLYLFPRYSHVI